MSELKCRKDLRVGKRYSASAIVLASLALIGAVAIIILPFVIPIMGLKGNKLMFIDIFRFGSFATVASLPSSGSFANFTHNIMSRMVLEYGELFAQFFYNLIFVSLSLAIISAVVALVSSIVYLASGRHFHFLYINLMYFTLPLLFISYLMPIIFAIMAVIGVHGLMKAEYLIIPIIMCGLSLVFSILLMCFYRLRISNTISCKDLSNVYQMNIYREEESKMEKAIQDDEPIENIEEVLASDDDVTLDETIEPCQDSEPIEMIACPNCGKQNPATNETCEECGALLHEEEAIKSEAIEEPIVEEESVAPEVETAPIEEQVASKQYVEPQVEVEPIIAPTIKEEVSDDDEILDEPNKDEVFKDPDDESLPEPDRPIKRVIIRRIKKYSDGHVEEERFSKNDNEVISEPTKEKPSVEAPSEKVEKPNKEEQEKEVKPVETPNPVIKENIEPVVETPTLRPMPIAGENLQGLPNNIIDIPEERFSKNNFLQSAFIPEGITRIGKSGFAHCNQLQEVYIPSSVNEISNMAFFKCPNLKTVYFGGTVEQFKCIKRGKGWLAACGTRVIICRDSDISVNPNK